MSTVAFLMLLVSTDQLMQLQDVQIVDVRGRDAYVAGHIPGALHLDSATLSEDRDGVNGLLKPVEEVAALLSWAGLDPARHVVVYGAMEAPDDLKHATRLFWILEYVGFSRVSVLDGGFAKWRAEGRPIETGEPRGPSGEGRVLSLRPRPELLATRDEVLEAITPGSGRTLVDMRPPEEYAGLAKEDFVARAGHIPGACNLPATDFVAKSGDEGTAYYALQPEANLRAAVEGSPAKPVITYCNSGRDASVGYFVYRLAGFERVAVYDGSMAEWGRHPGLNVAGEGPK